MWLTGDQNFYFQVTTKTIKSNYTNNSKQCEFLQQFDKFTHVISTDNIAPNCKNFKSSRTIDTTPNLGDSQSKLEAEVAKSSYFVNLIYTNTYFEEPIQNRPNLGNRYERNLQK